MRPVITLYARSGCHLCAEAQLLLARLAPELDFAIEKFDIDENGELLIRYDTIVPVIAVAGKEIARAPISEPALRRALIAALR